LSEAKSGAGIADYESAPDFASLNPGYAFTHRPSTGVHNTTP
jgi:hypothetical protein